MHERVIVKIKFKSFKNKNLEQSWKMTKKSWKVLEFDFVVSVAILLMVFRLMVYNLLIFKQKAYTKILLGWDCNVKKGNPFNVKQLATAGVEGK